MTQYYWTMEMKIVQHLVKTWDTYLTYYVNLLNAVATIHSLDISKLPVTVVHKWRKEQLSPTNTQAYGDAGTLN